MTEQDSFLALTNVSRETLDRLEAYEALLKKWNPAINLVSASTLTQIWSRHFLDSAQIFALAPTKAGQWADLGSGGGFPGLVVAVIAAEKAPDLSVTLVESDHRKAAFLMTTANALGLKVLVRTGRIEALPELSANVLSARALAPLGDLLGFAERHLGQGGTCLFSKGARWQDELKQAQEMWSFTYETHKSVTDPDAVVLKIEGVKRV